MEEKLYLSSSPHINGNSSTRRIMLDVIIALLPAAAVGCVIFGLRALFILIVTTAAAVIAEYICRLVMKRKNTISDLSAAVTGLLLGMNLPVSINPLIAIFGSVVAIVVVKQMFGGIGQNFLNPALTARIVLLISFPAAMSHWSAPFYWNRGAVDAITAATPLSGASNVSIIDMILGISGGTIGETSALALSIGGLYLIFRRVITPSIPLAYIGTVGVLSLIFHNDPMTQIFAGGLFIGAIFMATDYASTPLSSRGKLIYGFGCGLMTILIRQFGALPDGVSFSIILMNIFTPHIDNLMRPRPFGHSKKGIKPKKGKP